MMHKALSNDRALWLFRNGISLIFSRGERDETPLRGFGISLIEQKVGPCGSFSLRRERDETALSLRSIAALRVLAFGQNLRRLRFTSFRSRLSNPLRGFGISLIEQKVGPCGSFSLRRERDETALSLRSIAALRVLAFGQNLRRLRFTSFRSRLSNPLRGFGISLIETKSGALRLHFLFQEREGFEPSVL